MKRSRVAIWLALGEFLVIAALASYLVINRSTPALVRRDWWSGDIVYTVPMHAKLVALTYDDGPHPTFTPELLATLKEKKVKATFFMIGKDMEAYPDIVREVVREGHVIANHTYSHPRDIRVDTRAQVIHELERCEVVIERLTGKRPHLFRPPRGMLDSTVYSLAVDEGYRVALWTVCADHHDAPTPEAMAQRVVNHIRPGAIVLAHDGSFPSRWRDVAATPLIIDALRAKGYRFVTLPELLRHATPRAGVAR